MSDYVTREEVREIKDALKDRLDEHRTELDHLERGSTAFQVNAARELADLSRVVLSNNELLSKLIVGIITFSVIVLAAAVGVILLGPGSA